MIVIILHTLPGSVNGTARWASGMSSLLKAEDVSGL